MSMTTTQQHIATLRTLKASKVKHLAKLERMECFPAAQGNMKDIIIALDVAMAVLMEREM